jgi:hypothetical protein
MRILQWFASSSSDEKPAAGMETAPRAHLVALGSAPFPAVSLSGAGQPANSAPFNIPADSTLP